MRVTSKDLEEVKRGACVSAAERFDAIVRIAYTRAITEVRDHINRTRALPERKELGLEACDLALAYLCPEPNDIPF